MRSDRVAPFGPRAPPSAENAGSQAMAAVAGALCALAAVGLVALLRRRGRADRPPPAATPVTPQGASWTRAIEELNGRDFNGRALRVNEAQEKQRRPEGRW